MKRYYLHKLFLLVVFLSSISFCNDINFVMQKGNEYYKSNQFQSAVNEYNKLIKQGYQGTALYYNLGNAYYRLGKIGYSILYYEKVLKISPSDEDARHNLLLSKQNIKDKVDTLPQFFVFKLWEGLLSSFSATGWTIIVYIIFILLLVSIVAYFFSRNSFQQRLSFFISAGFLSILILASALLSVKINKELNIKDGIILESVVTVKLSPDESAKDGFVIHEGLKVRLEEKVDNWFKIRMQDGKVGWITNIDIAEI